MPLNNAPKSLYSKPAQEPLPYKEPPPKGLNLASKPRQPLNIKYRQPSTKPSGSFRPTSFGKDVNSNAYKDYNQNLSNQNLRTRKLINGRRTPFSKIPKGNNAVKAAPLAIKSSGIAAKTKSVALGTVKLGVASVSLWTLAIYGTVEGVFTRRAGITDEERKRAISQYYPGNQAKVADGVVPFEGGQGENVQYHITVMATVAVKNSYHGLEVGDSVEAKTINAPSRGAISGFEVTDFAPEQPIFVKALNNPQNIAYQHYYQGGQLRWAIDYEGNLPISDIFVSEIIGFSTERIDGQPDLDGNLPAVGEVVSSRIAPQPQPPFPADEKIIDTSPIASSNKPIPQPAKTTDPAPPPDNSEDIQAIKAKLNDIEKRLIDANPGGKEGKSNSAIADKEKAESLEQTVTKQKINQTNINNGLDIGINNSLVDIPAINPTNAIRPVVRSQKYSPEKLDKLKRQRRVEQIELERDADKAERQKKIDKLNNQIGNISGASVLPPPNIDVDKQIDITDGSKTGKEIKNEVTEQKKDEVIQTPKESDAELLGKIGALFTATPLLNKDGFKQAVEEAVCDSSQGGCLKSNVVDPLKTGQNNLTNVLQGFDFGLLTAIDLKLGEGIPGGIGGYLKKAWEVAQVDKIINMATLITSTHNAAMLSRNLGDTIAEVATQALQFLNIKSPTGEAIDIGEVIGNSVTGLIESLVPQDIRTNVSDIWLKANRIHTAAAGMASAISQTKNAILEVQELTTNYVAEIGNNMQEQGILEENSYPWMQDKNDFTNPYAGFLNKINNAEEIVEQASSFINSVNELKDSTTQLVTSKEEVTTALTAFSTEKQTDEDSKKTESTSPEIDRLDLIQLEEDEI